jgi:hypothetical protein
VRVNDRTAVYGPVRTVVWEGTGREARPYPDSRVIRLTSTGETSFGRLRLTGRSPQS